ncbi:MAG: hypothetical protein IT435_02780 [Phycisphaerales bacterium]|nr:hypothetical protein [Phycisphaerales bacterium]
MPDPIYFDMVKGPKGGWNELTLQQWLWWPARCFRVIAPEATNQGLNLFEQLVLGLCRARVPEALRQAALLGLDEKLVDTIQLQLRELGLLDGTLSVTPEGAETLRDAALDSGRLVTGYVFQDPFTGSLWDRFIEVENERYGQVERDGAATWIVRGAAGKERRHPTVLVDHPASQLPAPTPSDVSAAVRRHRRAIERWRQSRDADDGSSDRRRLEDTGDSASGARVGRVELLASTPVPCFVATYLYSRSSVPLPTSLLVADPFGLGASDRLLQQILDFADSDRSSPLARRLDSVLRKAHRTSYGEFREQARAFRLNAERRVEDEVGVDRRDLEAFPAMVRMEQAILESEALEDEQRFEQEMNAKHQARTALEAVLRSSLGKYSLAGIERYLDLPLSDRTREGMHRRLETLGQQIGLACPLPQHVSASMSFQRVRGITSDKQRVERAGVRDLFVINLLLALRDPAHPMRRAATQESALAQRVFDLADKCNPAAHGRVVSGARAGDVRRELYALVGLLVGSGDARKESV